MTKFSNLNEGDKILVHSRLSVTGELIETHITKMGRAYITVAFKKLRFCKYTGVQVDNYGVPARLYLTQLEYDTEKKMEGRKRYIKKVVANNYLDDQTAYNVFKALKEGGY